MTLRFAAVAAALCLAATGSAQDKNPRGAATGTVGGKKVTIDYGRPALKGRSIDELLQKLPEDRMWREGDITIGGKKIPAGKYSLYVNAPAAGEWSIAINSDLGLPLVKLWDKAPDNMKNEPWPHLEGYKNIATKELARAPMKSGKVSPAAELFTVDMKPAGSGSTLTLSWGERSWSLDVQPGK